MKSSALVLDKLVVPPVYEPYDLTSIRYGEFLESVKKLSPTNIAALLKLLDERLPNKQHKVPYYIALATAALLCDAHRATEYVQSQLAAHNKRLRVYVIQPVFNEAQRMSPRSKKNPHGENALLYRLERLKYLHELAPLINFELLVVDDGCDGRGIPEDISAEVAKKLLNQ